MAYIYYNKSRHLGFGERFDVVDEIAAEVYSSDRGELKCWKRTLNLVTFQVQILEMLEVLVEDVGKMGNLIVREIELNERGNREIR